MKKPGPATQMLKWSLESHADYLYWMEMDLKSKTLPLKDSIFSKKGVSDEIIQDPVRIKSGDGEVDLIMGHHDGQLYVRWGQAYAEKTVAIKPWSELSVSGLYQIRLDKDIVLANDGERIEDVAERLLNGRFAKADIGPLQNSEVEGPKYKDNKDRIMSAGRHLLDRAPDGGNRELCAFNDDQIYGVGIRDGKFYIGMNEELIKSQLVKEINERS